MNPPVQRQVIIVQSTKNPGVAALLGLLFGPLGVLYVGWLPSLILFVVCLPVILLTAGFGLFLTAPLCAIVGYTRANAVNRQLLAQGA